MLIPIGLGKAGLLPPRKKNSEDKSLPIREDGNEETNSDGHRSNPLIQNNNLEQSTKPLNNRITRSVSASHTKTNIVTGNKLKTTTKPIVHPMKQRNSNHSKTKTSKLHTVDMSDLIGAVIQVPAHVFKEDKPGLYYVCDITRPDPYRSNALEVVFRVDKSVYWFPVESIREWLKDMKLRGVILPLSPRPKAFSHQKGGKGSVVAAALKSSKAALTVAKKGEMPVGALLGTEAGQPSPSSNQKPRNTSTVKKRKAEGQADAGRREEEEAVASESSLAPPPPPPAAAAAREKKRLHHQESKPEEPSAKGKESLSSEGEENGAIAFAASILTEISAGGASGGSSVQHYGMDDGAVDGPLLCRKSKKTQTSRTSVDVKGDKRMGGPRDGVVVEQQRKPSRFKPRSL